MPISGFKPGQAALTPSGRPVTVIRAERIKGRERVLVRYDERVPGGAHVPFGPRWFDAVALRPV